MRIWHRLGTSCTADESWCKYVVLNRNGSANNLEAYARTYSPLAVFDELKWVWVQPERLSVRLIRPPDFKVT